MHRSCLVCAPALAVGALAVGALFVGGAGPPPSATGFETAGLTRIAAARGVVALGGGRFRLPDGRRGRLAGVAVPRLAPAGAKWRSEPLAGRAHTAFRTLLDGTGVALWVQKRRADRYGDLVGHLRTGRGDWVQGTLLAQGLALVRTRPEDRALGRAMLTIEARARAAGRGIWRLPRYRVRADREVRPGGFRIVEGVILTVAERRRFAYLNFGRDWRRDFTVRLDRAARRLFADAGIALPRLARRRIRVRGWVEDRGGPLIAVTHPEQIEILEAAPPRRPPARRSPRR